MKDNRVSTIIRLSRQAYGKYKPQIVVLIILGFIGGLLEGIGINALIPLFSFVIGKSQGPTDTISIYIEKLFLFFGFSFNLRYLLIFICLLFVVKAILLVIFSYIKVKITADYEAQTRNSLFKATLNAGWPYLLKQKLGYLETILMVDVRRSTTMFERLSGMIMMGTSLLVYVVVAINISLNITLTTLALGGVLFLLFKPLMYKTRGAATKAAKVNKEVLHFVSENIIGMKAVKAMHLNDKIINKGKEYFYYLRELHVQVYLLLNVSRSLLQPISLIFICAVFAVSYKLPDFNFAALIAIIYLIDRIFQYLQQLQTGLHRVSETIPYLKSVLDYEKTALDNREKNSATGQFKFNDRLEFKDVEFSYDHQQPQVLSKINFTVFRGKMVGLIGPSGSGKTTIVDLMLRLFEPAEGKILLDGKNISDISLKNWRKNIGYISQDMFLMNDTIANNIKFYDQTISNDDICRATKMANIYDFIQNCPDKFNTVIGERGIELSMGQRQRIVIARILARKPKILIMDEATSALDNESERKIQKVIESLKGKITVFVIAHRLSTIINSDKVLVLEDGKIKEQGNVKKLLSDKKSYFYKVYNVRK